MADVHIEDRGGSAAWIWAVVALLLVGLIAWFIIGNTRGTTADGGVDVDVNVPSAPAGEGSGGSGGGQ